jgi:CRISPR-associated endonuclease/helicase Cas3
LLPEKTLTRAENKASRLLEIEALLLAHPEGLTQAELARRLGVNRSTILRNLADASKHIYPEDDGRMRIDRTAYLVNVRLNLDEALALHLATRLLATRLDRQNPHAAAALRKLGISMEKLAPRISAHMLQSADVMDDPDFQRQDPIYLAALERLTLAWAELRKVQVWHRHDDNHVYEYIFAPYFIEPYAVGQTTHVIGLRQPPGEVRTFKVERLERVELLHEPYEIPPDFDPRAFLRSAWGIWFTEGKPIRVVLQFSGRVARRVKETRWHPSQELQDLPGGGVLWQAEIAEPREMLPWIRGWGADVEVLEPPELRQKLAQETRSAAIIYGWKVSEDDLPKPQGNEKTFQSAVSADTTYYAHTKGLDKSNWQSVKEHLVNTANIALLSSSDTGLSEFAYIASLLHDIGKYSLAFQKKLNGAKIKVDHSTPGAKEIISLFKQTPKQRLMSTMLAYCIAGHHGGLPDYGSLIDFDTDGTLQARLKREVERYDFYSQEIDVSKLTLPEYIPIKPITKDGGFSLAFFTRMVYSILVDADFVETETFMNSGMKPRGGYLDIAILYQKYIQFLKQFDSPKNKINQQRTQTLKDSLDKAAEKPGLFTLTVPTGGGKTFASLAFALKHAHIHDMKRIIYVIPYTSIIEQNAAEFKKCFGSENVLEHHSNFDWNGGHSRKGTEFFDDQTNNAYDKLKLAAENWDIPIVVTTNVQFFESLFANRSSRSRKIHNIAKSVIIFDEAQMLPQDYIRPCLYAVYELVKNYGASAILCTATQPSVENFLPKGAQLTELCPNPQALFDFYKRVQVKHIGRLPDADLIQRISDHQQALCIVNTRKHAKGLFDGVIPEGRFHLSTLMCPAHRKKTIATIRERLKQGQTCRVISTQIMEAGIDVDFPVGYRALSGLDSIIQAAGRVNREGKQPSGDLYVFEPVSDFVKRTPAYIQQGAAVANNILRKYNDPVCAQAIKEYYTSLYDLQDSKAFDRKGILDCFEKGISGEADFDFMTAAEKFKLIENDTMPVVIQYDQEAVSLLEKIRSSSFPLSFSRELQTYTVNIYEQEFEALQSKGLIDTYGGIFSVLNNDEYYKNETGLVIPESGGGAAIFFDG